MGKIFSPSICFDTGLETFKMNEQPFKSSCEIVELLKNCAWYSYEIGEMEESLRIVGNAPDACDEKGLPASQLYNNAECAHCELNNLVRGREDFERCLAIRSGKLAEDGDGLGNLCNNLTGLLLSEKN